MSLLLIFFLHFSIKTRNQKKRNQPGKALNVWTPTGGAGSGPGAHVRAYQQQRSMLGKAGAPHLCLPLHAGRSCRSFWRLSRLKEKNMVDRVKKTDLKVLLRSNTAKVHRGSEGEGPADMTYFKNSAVTSPSQQNWTQTKPTKTAFGGKDRADSYRTPNLRTGGVGVGWHSPTLTSATASTSAAVTRAQACPDILKAEEESKIKKTT